MTSENVTIFTCNRCKKVLHMKPTVTCPDNWTSLLWKRDPHDTAHDHLCIQCTVSFLDFMNMKGKDQPMTAIEAISELARDSGNVQARRRAWEHDDGYPRAHGVVIWGSCLKWNDNDQKSFAMTPEDAVADDWFIEPIKGLFG